MVTRGRVLQYNIQWDQSNARDSFAIERNQKVQYKAISAYRIADTYYYLKFHRHKTKSPIDRKITQHTSYHITGDADNHTRHLNSGTTFCQTNASTHHIPHYNNLLGEEGPHITESFTSRQIKFTSHQPWLIGWDNKRHDHSHHTVCMIANTTGLITIAQLLLTRLPIYKGNSNWNLHALKYF